MIYPCNTSKKDRKRALREVYAAEPIAPTYNPWSEIPIYFDRRDHATSVRHGGMAALVLDLIIEVYHLTKVLMDGSSNLDLINVDTFQKMNIDESRIELTKTRFKGIIPRKEAECIGRGTLDMVFGTPENCRLEPLSFEIVPFQK